ncbi:MAG: prenyltransferase/squalene oxidase repeat-containing protein [bacterium]
MKKKLVQTITKVLKSVIVLTLLLTAGATCIPQARADSGTIGQSQAVQQGVNWLIKSQSEGGAWEPYSVVQGNSLAIRAFVAMKSRASSKCNLLLKRLKELQSSDGSWNENIVDTAYAVWALIDAGEDKKSPVIQSAVLWLSAGSDFSDTTAGNTKVVSLTLIALLKAGETSPLLSDGIAWLKDNQNQDGFWGTSAGEPSVPWVKEAVMALILAESPSSTQVKSAVSYLRTHYVEYYGYDAIEGLEVFTCAGDAEYIQIGQTKVLSEQNGQDSGWGKFPDWPSQNAETAKAVFTLAQSGYNGDPLNRAFKWIEVHLSDTGDYEGDYAVVPSTAWAILGLSAVQDAPASVIDQAVDLLIGSQNGGWGWWSIYHPETVGSETDTTAICAWALHGSGKEAGSIAIQQAAAALRYGQNDDGGWGAAWLMPGKSTVSSTNCALIAVLCAGDGQPDESIDRAVQYLVANSVDSHWESVGQTAMSVIALQKIPGNEQVVEGALEWLIQNQNEDGGWGMRKGEVSSIASTAITMIALSECRKAQIPAMARGAAFLRAVQNTDGGWSDLAGVPSSNTAGTSQAVWALALAEEYLPSPELEIALDQKRYCPGNLVVARASSSSEILHFNGRLISPSGKITLLDFSPVSAPAPVADNLDEGDGSMKLLYQAIFYLDTNAPAGTYLLTLNADSPAENDSSTAASFSVYPVHSCFRDADSDGFGDPGSSLLASQAQDRFVPDYGDCDDRDSNINPAALEMCDELDNNCNGQIDEELSRCCGAGECPAQSCDEGNSGEIKIEGARGMLGEEIKIAVSIQDPSLPLFSLGFHVTYEAGVLEYLGFERGDLVTAFPLFGVDQAAGTLKVSGSISQDSIPEGTNGCVVWLKFMVLAAPDDTTCSPLQIGGLSDHIACFSSKDGCFLYIRNEDVNKDGNITLEDARMVFDGYFGLGPSFDYFDLNGDGEVTPVDALIIFRKCQDKALDLSDVSFGN